MAQAAAAMSLGVRIEWAGLAATDMWFGRASHHHGVALEQTAQLAAGDLGDLLSNLNRTGAGGRSRQWSRCVPRSSGRTARSACIRAASWLVTSATRNRKATVATSSGLEIRKRVEGVGEIEVEGERRGDRGEQAGPQTIEAGGGKDRRKIKQVDRRVAPSRRDEHADKCRCGDHRQRLRIGPHEADGGWLARRGR